MPYYLGLIGIISIEGNIRDQYPLVQSRCHYNIVDVYSITELVQDYHSSAPISRDVEYVFPLPPGAAVCSFKAVIDNKKTIKGVVKEKGQAKTEYKAAVAQGKTAGLLEQEHPDVFRVSLGNIKPNQKISVHISFISIVTHDASSPQTLRITMPTSIAPRYGSPPANIPWWKPNNHNRFDLTVAIQMNKAITSVSSPSHPIGLTLGCAEKELKGDFEPSKAFVYLGDSAFLEKDIVVVISAQGLDVPRCSVERWLASEGGGETTDAYALTLVPKFDFPPLPNQEYIFLVDRSGSMEGGRMESVKASLQIMLRSLPSRDTTFNIVSFGSSYSSLWPTSQAYSAESVEQASKHVDTFSANFGGTELRSAIQFALKGRTSAKSSSNAAAPTSVFLLTDGEAWDLDGVLHEISTAVKAAKDDKGLLRTFVLGVGNEVSTAIRRPQPTSTPGARPLPALPHVAPGGGALARSASTTLADDDEDYYEEEVEAIRSGLWGGSAYAAPAAPASSNYASAKPLVPTLLNVEYLARAQKFDGSFPIDSQYISLVTSGGTLSLPNALSGLGGSVETKKAVWATLLTIACMEKRLAGEKDVWEFLADKARDYISATLQDLCKDAAKAEALIKELAAAASRAV
ncbi:VIT-domain-containing protein [Serendipita vermifera]|nr:VIT-domain-containing protein [Serendipita vermifera]